MNIRITTLLLLLGASSAFAQTISGTSTTVSTLTTGTVLDARASVSPDHRYVTIGIRPQFSQLDGIDTFSNVGTSLSGGASLPRTINNGFGANYRPAVVDNITFIEKDPTLLNRKLPAAELKATTLRQAAAQLGQSAKTNVVLSTRALQQANIDDKATFDLALEECTLREAVIALLAVAVPHEPMVITADDNVIFLTTQAQADLQMVSKTYDLAVLQARAPRFLKKAQELAARKKVEPVYSGDFFSKPVNPPTIKPSFDSNDIIAQITNHVRPELWRVNGGKSDITQHGQKVSINAPASMHVFLMQ